MAEQPGLRVTVACSPAPRETWEKELLLPVGSTCAQALVASGVAAAHPGLDLGTCAFAVWGKKASPQHALREGDRLEILRPLKVDPKTARRERFSRQGARAAGLFAMKKPGTEPGS